LAQGVFSSVQPYCFDMQRSSFLRVCLIVVLLGVVECQPTFPDGVSQILESMKSRQPTAPDDGAKVEKLIAAGGASLTRDVTDEFVKSDFEKAAYVKTHLRVVKYKFVGGCPRDTTGCPTGWTMTGSACAPPSDYDGLCGPVDFDEYQPDEKEAWAWKCRASFPCAQQSVNATVSARDSPFESKACPCPKGWSHEGNQLCVAPRRYAGKCSPATSFEGYTDAQKDWWSTSCNAPWSCLQRQGSLQMSLILDGLSEELIKDYPTQPTAAVNKALADALVLSTQNEDIPSTELSPLGTSTPDYDLPCPEGWTLDLVHDCFAPSSYTGPCVRRKAFNKYNVVEKAEWAKVCAVTWPPAANNGRVGSSPKDMSSDTACAPDYTKDCPHGWASTAGYCQAPAIYKGSCGYFLRTATFSVGQKRAIAEACKAPWACA